MISVTRLDGTPMVVNCDQIAWVEFMPDTVISLMNGEKLIVREKPDQVVERVKDFKRSVHGTAQARVLRAPLSLADVVDGE